MVVAAARSPGGGASAQVFNGAVTPLYRRRQHRRSRVIKQYTPLSNRTSHVHTHKHTHSHRSRRDFNYHHTHSRARAHPHTHWRQLKQSKAQSLIPGQSNVKAEFSISIIKKLPSQLSKQMNSNHWTKWSRSDFCKTKKIKSKCYNLSKSKLMWSRHMTNSLLSRLLT